MLGKVLGKPLNKMLKDTGKEALKEVEMEWPKVQKEQFVMAKILTIFLFSPDMVLNVNDIYNVLNF